MPDYNRFYNEQYANAVIYVSQVVKELTDNSIFTTYLYGYYLSYTITPRPVETGAFAVTKIMESPYVDSLSATNSYANRSPKSLNYNTMLVDSLALNGKLFFTEDDTRTYLAYTDIEAEGDGEGDREYKSKSYENTIAILGRNFSYDMIRDQGLYWMDMHNCGWYNNSDLWQQMAEMRRIWAAYNYSASSAPTPDVALIVDDESIYYESNSCPNSHYIMDQIDELVKAGLNYGVYLKCDIDKIPESAKIIIVTACSYMEADDIEAFNSQKRDGKIIIWNWAPSYITDTSCSVDNISSMTGMNIEEVESISNLMTKVTNFDHKYTKNADNQFGSLGKATPGFVVSDSEAVTLGIYKQSEYVSLAVKEFENWTSIFAGSGCLEAPVLASM